MKDESGEARSPGTPTSEGAADRGVLELVHRFLRLSGTASDRSDEGLLRVRIPHAYAPHFGERRDHVLALDLERAQQHPDAEVPVVGSAFWNGILESIRQHGHRRVRGVLKRTAAAGAPEPDVEVRGTRVELSDRTLETRRLILLTCRVGFSAGTTVYEELAQSDAIDLTSGLAVPRELADLVGREVPEPLDAGAAPAALASSARLVETIVGSLEAHVADQVEVLRAQAYRELKEELARVDRYFGALTQEVEDESGPDSSGVRTIRHEHERRRGEEIRRFQTRAEVQPLQVVEVGVEVERVTWRLVSDAGREAELQAQRYLSGDVGWGIHCPQCGKAPEAIGVCRGGHPSGTECLITCSVCEESFCTEHGHAACAVDGAPVCREHAGTCFSCDRVHCDEHSGRCDEGDHSACTDCLVHCGICSRRVCRRHGITTHAESPRGERTLCASCVVYCEGGTSEPVGRDEAAACGTCDRHICERHQVRCVVDGLPHCSSHLKRADRSRRFVCERHITRCDFEDNAVFAEDEVHSCVECGRASCARHGSNCHHDDRWHCLEHLAELNDVPHAAACEVHRSTCHVDGRAFSLQGTRPCDACGRNTCRSHNRSCRWCGGEVCAGEIEGSRCATCSALSPVSDPPSEVVAAASRFTPDRGAKAWWMARDAGRFVVQLDLGWTRRIVLSVPHGSATATRVMRHSMFGSAEGR